MADVTRILQAIEGGDSQASDQLLPLVYEELRQLASLRIGNEKPGQTLQATALVHEAYLRLVDATRAQHWTSRGHFFGAAAEAMRRILIERARKKASLKRGGNLKRVNLDKLDVTATAPEDLLCINEALEKLEKEDSTAAQLVKLRYFAGLSLEKTANVMGISTTAAFRHWSYARVWLRTELVGDRESP